MHRGLDDLGNTLYGKVTVIAEINRHHCHFRLYLYCGCQISVVTYVSSCLNLDFVCARNLLQRMQRDFSWGGWAHISPLLHLSNPVTLTTNETLHTCILFVPVTAKMDVALSCYLRLDGWMGIARWVRYRVPLGRFRSEIQMKLLKTSKNSFKYGTGSVH